MELKDLAVEHPYYCNLSNYHSVEPYGQYETLSDFLEAFKNTDMDYNLLFRWDVKKKTDEDDDSEDDSTEKESYSAEFFFVMQRKGDFRAFEVKTLTEEDVESFLDFVRPRYEHLLSLWTPLKV